MKKQKWKQWCAKLLVLCLLATQTITSVAQVDGGNAALVSSGEIAVSDGDSSVSGGDVEEDNILTSFEVLAESKEVFYCEFGDAYHEGLKLKLNFADGTSKECEPGDELWYQYSFGILIEPENGQELERNENNTPVAGKYTLIIMCSGDYNVESVRYPITYKTIADTDKVLSFDTVTTLSAEREPYKLTITEDGYYKFSGTSTPCVYDEQLKMVDAELYFYYYLTAGEYIAAPWVDKNQENTMCITKVPVVEVTADTACSTNVASQGTEVWYKFVPEITAQYTFKVTSEEYNYKWTNLWDSSWREVVSSQYGVDDLQAQVQLTAGETYYLWVNYDEQVTETYQVVFEKEIQATGVVFEYTKGNGVYYYGVNKAQVPLADTKLEITYDDGMVIAPEVWSDEWYNVISTWSIRDAVTQEVVYQDEFQCYPEGEYYMELIMLDGSVFILPMTVKPSSEYDVVLNTENMVTLTNPAAENVDSYVRVEIAEAGQYAIDLAGYYSYVIYDSEWKEITSNYGNYISLNAEEVGNYYVRVWISDVEKMLSMEKLLSIVDIQFETTKLDYYYGVSNSWMPYDAMYTVYFEDGTSVSGFRCGSSSTETQDIIKKYGLSYEWKCADGSWPSLDDIGCYPMGEYTIKVSCQVLDTDEMVIATVHDKSEIPNVLSVEQPLTGLPGNEELSYTKVVFDEPGVYKFSSSVSNSWHEVLCDENNNKLFDGIYYNLDYLTLTINEPCTYYLSCYSYIEEGTYDISLEKLALPEKIETNNYDNKVYDVWGYTDVWSTGVSFLLLLEDGTTKSMSFYDDVWNDYDFSAELYKASDLTTVIESWNNLEVGDYVLKVSNGLNEVACDVSFSVLSKEDLPMISLDTPIDSEFESEMYRLDIMEDGLYNITTTGAEGYFTFFDTNLNYVTGRSLYKDENNALELKAGSYYVSTYNRTMPTTMNFIISKLADIASLTYASDEKLEIVYGTWGYKVGNTISGSYVTSSNSLSKPMNPGEEITGMKNSTGYVSGNYYVSGNNVQTERFSFDLTLQATLEDGKKLDISFNSLLWDLFGFVEKLFNLDGSAIIADENGYAAIGDYMVEFEAQGQSVEIPFYVVESETMRDIRKTDIVFDTQYYTGEGVEAVPTITYGEDVLTLNKDYTITYQNNVEVGMATAVITGTGDYSGTVTAEFEIQLFKVVVEEISQETITETIKEKTGCDTIEELIEYIVGEILDVAIKLLPEAKEENVQSMDVTLQTSPDGGKTWVDVDPDNFPEEGVEVILPYPEGTDESYNFVIGHLISHGEKNGEMEYFSKKNGNMKQNKHGMQIRVHSTSPFIVAWTELALDESTPAPEVTPVPEVTPAPEVTPVPEVTPIPEATPAPEVTPAPTTEPTQAPVSSGNTTQATPAPIVTEAPASNGTSPKTYDDSIWNENAAESKEAEEVLNSYDEYPVVVIGAEMAVNASETSSMLWLIVVGLMGVFAVGFGVCMHVYLKKEEE